MKNGKASVTISAIFASVICNFLYVYISFFYICTFVLAVKFFLPYTNSLYLVTLYLLLLMILYEPPQLTLDNYNVILE